MQVGSIRSFEWLLLLATSESGSLSVMALSQNNRSGRKEIVWVWRNGVCEEIRRSKTVTCLLHHACRSIVALASMTNNIHSQP